MAGTPRYRFKIWHSSYPLGEQIQTPQGWDECKLKLERHAEYHSLVEYFEGSFVFWGHGYQVIKAIEIGFGIDALVRLTIEIKFSSEWNLLFDGQLDLSQIEDIQKGKAFYKCKLPIIRSDFWAKFINRKATEVHVMSAKNLDNGDVSIGVPQTVTLLPQVLQQIFEGSQNGIVETDGSTFALNNYFQYAFDSNVVLSEITEMYPIPFAINTTKPTFIFTPELEGDYAFNITVPYLLYALPLPGGSPTYYYDAIFRYLKTYIQINDDDPIIFTWSGIEYEVGLIPTFTTTVKVNFAKYNGTHTLKAGDKVRIYSKITDVMSVARLQVGGVYGTESMRMKITGATIYPFSSAQGILIKDCAEYILDRITGQENVVVSSFFETPAKGHLLLNGKHVRGYQFAEKALSVSWDQWYQGTNAMFNIGCGYDLVTEDGIVKDKIRIEKKEYFYNPEMSVLLNGVGNMVRTYSKDYFFKEVQVGFKKWSAESTSGIDDIQTKAKYSLRFSKNGKPLNIESELYAAGLGIEQTRRNKREAGKDWKLDEELMIIAGGVTDLGGFYVEQGNFSATTGILHPESRYNLRHSPAAIMKRWQNYIQACIQQYNGDKIKFTSGEGNYSSSVTRTLTDWEFAEENITDGVDITVDVVTEIPLFFPVAYELKQFPMSYDTYNLIRTNRNNAIGISKTNSGHKPYFIFDMAWSPQHGKADLLLVPKYLSDTFDI